MKRYLLLITGLLMFPGVGTSTAQPFKLGGSPPTPPSTNKPQDKPATPDSTPGAAGSKSTSITPITLDEPSFQLEEFPPGLFTDGNYYRLKDLRGKVIVLYFFDPRDPQISSTAADRNALMARYREKPVEFFGVMQGTFAQVQSAARATGLAMPIFADTLGVMMERYKVRLVPKNSWVVCIIDGAGQISREEMTDPAINKALESASKFKYRDRTNFDPRVTPAIEALEVGDYERAMKLVNGWATGKDKGMADCTKQVQAVLRADAEVFKSEAERVTPTAPIEAYDFYNRIVLTCPGSDIAQSINDPMKKLEGRRDVKAELAARQMYKILCAAISRDQRVEKWDAVGYCEEIIRISPGTPTAEMLITYMDDLSRVAERGKYGTRRRGS